MNRKKVVILYSGSRNWGGIDNYLLNLFKYYDRSKVDLTLVSLGNWAVVREIEKQGGKIKIFSGKRFNLLTVFKVARYLRKEHISLIVSGGLVADSYSRVASLFSGVPHLSIVHSEFKYDYPNLVLRFIYSLALLISKWKTKQYIAVSEYIKFKLQESGVKGDKITVVYNGVDFKEIPNRVKKDKSQIIIGSVGRLHKVKGYENLIKAAAMHKKDNWMIEIVGAGQEEKNLNNLIDFFRLKDRVKLLGHIDDMEKKYNNFDLYIQPSLSEGFGLTVVEAMGTGLPVIVTPVGSLPEIVRDSETGIIAEGTDPESLSRAINQLLESPEKSQKMGLLASEDVRKRFNIKSWNEKTIDVFLEASK